PHRQPAEEQSARRLLIDLRRRATAAILAFAISKSALTQNFTCMSSRLTQVTVTCCRCSAVEFVDAKEPRMSSGSRLCGADGAARDSGMLMSARALVTASTKSSSLTPRQDQCAFHS